MKTVEIEIPVDIQESIEAFSFVKYYSGGWSKPYLVYMKNGESVVIYNNQRTDESKFPLIGDILPSYKRKLPHPLCFSNDGRCYDGDPEKQLFMIKKSKLGFPKDYWVYHFPNAETLTVVGQDPIEESILKRDGCILIIRYTHVVKPFDIPEYIDDVKKDIPIMRIFDMFDKRQKIESQNTSLAQEKEEGSFYWAVEQVKMGHEVTRKSWEERMERGKPGPIFIRKKGDFYVSPQSQKDDYDENVVFVAYAPSKFCGEGYYDFSVFIASEYDMKAKDYCLVSKKTDLSPNPEQL